MEWEIYNMLILLNETEQRENISIIIMIIKVKDSSIEWCIVCLSKISLDKATR